jgi:hypothetical protein
MDQTENSDQMDSMSHSKKEALLNKFLSSESLHVSDCWNQALDLNYSFYFFDGD